MPWSVLASFGTLRCLIFDSIDESGIWSSFLEYKGHPAILVKFLTRFQHADLSPISAHHPDFDASWMMGIVRDIDRAAVIGAASELALVGLRTNCLTVQRRLHPLQLAEVLPKPLIPMRPQRLSKRRYL